MKINKLFILFSLSLCASTMSAQTVNVPFSTNAAGKNLPINWGMDTAWDDEYNVKWGIAHYGSNFTTGRISFQPYELVDATKINDANANFGLPLKMARKLQSRIDKIKWTGTTKVAINCDHEALYKAMDDNGNLGETQAEGKRTGYNNYVTSNVSTNATRWYNLIKASVKYAQNQGLEVVSVAPFNESDYGWCQYSYTIQYNDFTRATPASQVNGQKTFLEIAKLIKADNFFDDIRVCGGNTLSAEYALSWYNYLKDYLDEGNTHQLGGTFNEYASFFTIVKNDGKVATADELHNVGEAIVGVEYGMTNGIWWAFCGKARSQFMMDSNEGSRIGYAEDRSHWTAAAVYRNDKQGQIHGFIGSSERQANASTYNFQSQDREVYFNGYGPQKEWSVTTTGIEIGGYRTENAVNYEYFFDITYGEDVQSAPVDGNYQIMSAADMKLLTFTNGADVTATEQANNTTQRWHIYPDNIKAKGDCSYWFIDLQSDANAHLNLRDGNLAAGATLLTYNANHDALEQFYFRYAKDGYFYIITRQSNKYMYNNNGSISVQDGPTSKTGANELKKYMWRLMPTDATADQTAPAIPTGLAEGAVTSASVNISWTAVSEANVTYNVLRQDANGWNTIARCQASTTYTDTKVEAGKGYRYKVQAVDYSGNRSEASETITIFIPEEEGGETPTFTEGQWQWIGETSATGDYYLMNKSTKTFLKDNNTLNADGTLWNLTNTGSGDNVQWTIKCKEATPHYLYVNRTGKSASSLSASNFTAYCNGQNLTTSVTLSNVFWVKGDANGYTFNSYVQYKDKPQYYGSAASGDIYIGANNTNLATGVQSNSSADTYKWLFISSDQYTKYAKMSDYTTAFKAAKGYLTADLSSALMNELVETLDACDGTINYQNIEDNITRLSTIASSCQSYLDNPPAGEDMTSMLSNNWSEADGEHHQEAVVPNGLYSITSTNNTDELYGETYKRFEGSETNIILVTDNSIQVGYTGELAGSIILTRVSEPENTALSHYTNAIAYLNTEAEKELGRNIDHTELMAAYNAANSCEANVDAYETAINNLYAAIQKSKAMVAAEPMFSGSWIGQTGNYAGDFAERYNWDNPYPEGRILYQVVEDLIPGAEYEIQFYAVANVARNLDAGQYSGSGIAYLFANSTEQDIDVIYQDGCTPTNYPRTLRAVADENGQIAYGIANRKAGGQWYVAKAKSITFLGMPHTANLKVAPGKYGTFVAPFDIEVPAGVMTYIPSVTAGSNQVQLTEKVTAGQILDANTPVIVYNNTIELIEQNFTDIVQEVPATISEGCLVGFYMTNLLIPINGHTYVLQTQNDKQAFYKVNSTFHGVANRCYLVMPEATQANVLRFDFDEDEETGIDEIEGVNFVIDGEDINREKTVFDLSGRKVNPASAKKGIYIINGKKVLK